MENQAVFSKDLFPEGLKVDRKTLADPDPIEWARPQPGPLAVMVRKEIADHIRSWRFIILLSLILCTFLAAMYVSVTNLRSAISKDPNHDQVYVYLKLLTTTDGSLPPFHVFISFLGALLGIGLGFDAINSEQNNGTLARLLSQPVYRDNVLLSKFIGGLAVISVLFISLTMLMTGFGMLVTGVRMEWAECARILAFVVTTIIYVGFWLSLSICFSIYCRQPATSALVAIGVWLFLTIFYRFVVDMIVKGFFPEPAFLSPEEMISWSNLRLDLLRIMPAQLYTDATTTLLLPSVRSLGPLTMEQMAAAIPTPLPVRESLLIVWPQLTGLIAGAMGCFALAYFQFMRREIRT